jgi:hypothetical protein
MNGHDFLDAAEAELRVKVTAQLVDLEAEAEHFLKAVREAKRKTKAHDALVALNGAQGHQVQNKVKMLRDSLRTLDAFEEGK